MKQLTQSDIAVLMLVRVAGQLAAVRGTVVVWLNICTRSTGECSAPVADAASMRPEGGDLLGRSIRLVVIDSGFANWRAERNLIRLRLGGWSLLHLTCDVHRYASILDMANTA